MAFHQVSWEEYEELLEQVGQAGGTRISYDQGTLQVMTSRTMTEFMNRLRTEGEFKPLLAFDQWLQAQRS